MNTNTSAGSTSRNSGGVRRTLLLLALLPLAAAPHPGAFSDADWLSLNPNGSGSQDVGIISATAVDERGNLYVAGGVGVVGLESAEQVAKWDGQSWSSLGFNIQGLDGPGVGVLAVIGTNLYAGGSFTNAGGVSANNIARWDGTAWSPLGSGLNASVYALATDGTNLYAGGYFTTAGGVPALHVAKWDGNSWSVLGAGVDGAFPPGYPACVVALALSGSNIFVGGTFTNAGGVLVSNIAKWDGSCWSALGSGMDASIGALALCGTNLYAGGEFAVAGGVSAQRIAKWNGSEWSALGVGLGNGSVGALAVNGTNLYVGGSFNSAGGVWAQSIAKWDGDAWSALGSCVSSYPVFGFDFSFVTSMITDRSGHLFVAGSFLFAGTNWSPGIAQANIGPGVSGGRLEGALFFPLSGFSCTFTDATPGQPYRIQGSPSLLSDSWTEVTNFNYTGPMVINDPSAIGAPRRFYRAVSP